MPDPTDPGDVFAEWLNAALSKQGTEAHPFTPETEHHDTEEID